MFRGSVKGTGYPLHSPVSPSFPLTCVTVYHQISTGLYLNRTDRSLTQREAEYRHGGGGEVPHLGSSPLPPLPRYPFCYLRFFVEI